MIHTEDLHFVTDYCMVYEIRYTRYNYETSLAESCPIMASEASGKIWKDVIQCDRECIKINNANRYDSLEEQPLTVKMIAECLNHT